MASIGIDDEQWIWFSLFGLLYLSFYFFTSPFVGNPELLNLWTPYVYISMTLYGWLVAAALIHIPLKSIDFLDATVIKQPISLIFPFFSASFTILTILEFSLSVLIPIILKYFRIHWEIVDVPLLRSLFNIIRNSAAISVACVALLIHCDAPAHSLGPATYNGHVCDRLFDFSSKSKVMLPVPASYQGVLLIWSVGVLLAITNFALQRISGIRVMSFNWFNRSKRKTTTLPEDDGEEYERVPHEHRLPMVPWYSMLLFNTAFEILVSLKLFLGRFDHRSLQRALYSSDEDYTFDYLAERDELWMDFVADCGDGFDSTYQVARLLAQPNLHVDCPVAALQEAKDNQQAIFKQKFPRGDVLILGGDLAYPHPDPFNYESRLWRIYEYAMKPPAFYHPRAVSTEKRKLPARYNTQSATTEKDPDGTISSLKNYEGPCAFAIPGNHDWFDGLGTFTRFICNRDWLGGWYLPQRTSHFILKLPKGWWLFGVDLALENDINTEQYALFQRVVEKDMQPNDAVIIAAHEPNWILDGFEGRESSEEKLTYLINHVLNGRAVVRLAGDIHNYMRHSLVEKEDRFTQKNLPSGSASDDTKSHASDCVTSDGNLKSHTDGSKYEALALTRNVWTLVISYFSRIFDVNAECDRFKASPIQRNTNAMSRPVQHYIVSGGGGAFLHPTHAPICDDIRVHGSHYAQKTCYPPKHVSRRYTFLNVFGFRRINWRFDIIGGLGYFCLVVSMFPRCSVRDIYTSSTWMEMAKLFVSELIAVQYEMLAKSYLSLATYLHMLLLLIFFADCSTLFKQVFVGFVMSYVHFIAAFTCMVLYECILDLAIHMGGLGQDGSHSLYQFFTTNVYNFGSLIASESCPSTFHSVVELYAIFMRYCMTIFDVPEAVAIHRRKICDHGGFDAMTRLDIWGYYLSVFPYYFVLATPVVSAIFGMYLYLSLNVWNAHYNEAFSALRISSYKNFLRMHIQSNGDLSIYAFGIDKMPRKWCRDPLWSGSKSHSERSLPSFQWSCPSYWKPKATAVDNILRLDLENREFDKRINALDRSRVQLIDQVIIKNPSLSCQ